MERAAPVRGFFHEPWAALVLPDQTRLAGGGRPAKAVTARQGR